MKKALNSFLLILLILSSKPVLSQIDTSFWFAAPFVTPDHWWKDEIKFHISGPSGTVVKLRQPNMSGVNKYDTTFTIPASGNFDYTLWKNKLATSTSLGFDFWEARPSNTVLPYGIYISSTANITVVYDIITRSTNFYNPETFSLKGQNGLGKEFVCPFQTIYRNSTIGGDVNGDGITTQPKQQINIIASKPNTTVWITPKCNTNGHLANVTYSIVLPNAGDIYTIENSFQNTYISGQNLSGTIIVSDKDISVTVADDTVSNPDPAGSMGCQDLMGDQIVPVDVIGTDYILNLGKLYKINEISVGHPGMRESVYIVATENFTQVSFNNGATSSVILNKGDTYRFQLTTDLTYVHSDKNVYCLHVSGLGCELGEAIIPPLNCAGSKLVAFSRTNPQQFLLNILCKSGSQGTFSLGNASNSITIPISAASFTVVPGTAVLPGGPYYGTQINLNSTATLPIGSYTISNSTEEFALGVFGGDLGTGGLFHYMSSFLRKVYTNAGVDKNICTATPTVGLTGTVDGGSSTGVWTTPNGTGTFGNINSLNTTYTLSANDLNQSQIKFILSSTGNCTPIRDTLLVNVFKSPIVDAGNGLTLCKNNITTIPLNGSLQLAAGATWTTSGSGSFGNQGALNTTYLPSPSDLAGDSVTIKLTSTGSLNGCPNTTDSFRIRFTKPPVVTMGANASVCANNATVAISGSVTVGSTTGIWSGGTGNFNPSATILTSTYTPTPTEIAAGSVYLVLSSTNNGNCNVVKDSIQLTFTSAPFVNSGADLSSCTNNPATVISGVVSGPTTTGIWASGTGTYNPNNTSLNLIYTPTAAEISAGFVYLTLSSTNNGNCNQNKDSVRINFTPSPVVNAGTNLTACKNNASVVLTGSVSGATTTGDWTGGAGSYAPNNAALNATYTPTSGELAAGATTLYLTSSNNGNCTQVVDAVVINFNNAPVVNAGADIYTCQNNISTTLSGIVTGTTTSGIWTGGSGSYNPGNAVLNTTYTPSSSEIAAGILTLYLTSTGNGNCNQVKDSVLINFTSAPSVNAGNNITACTNNPAISLSGGISGPTTTGIWSSGTGTYNPGNTSLNPIYTPSPSEIAAGSATLILNSSNNGNCNVVTDSIVIYFTNGPVAAAGQDLTSCKNNPTVNLSGSISGPTTTGIWSGGSGFYSMGAGVLNTNYTPSASELSAGFVNLILSSTNNGNCNQATDTVKLIFTGSPLVTIGPDVSICANNATVAINGSVTVGATTGVWTGNGTGTFAPSTTSLNTVYQLSDADITQGSVTIKLSSTNNGNCLAEFDSLIVTVTPRPLVNAGVNDTICSSNVFYNINGSVTAGATAGTWSTLGNGIFNNPNNLNTTYTLGQADTTAGSVKLILTSTGGNCLPETDTVLITISKSPVVIAGFDNMVCDNQQILLNGNVSGALTTTGAWTTLGTGVFTPDDSLLITNYQPSALDVSNGFVNLVLSSTYNKGCLGVSDTVKLTFKPSPFADFNTNNVCSKKLATFTDNSTSSTGSITGWYWDFGDASLPSTTNNPTHAYANPGTYTVSHVAYSNNGCNDTVKKTIDVYFLPQALFYQNTPCVGNTTQFIDSSKTASGVIAAWQWNFGDSQFSNIQNPQHAFSAATNYTVSLVVTSSFGCKDTLEKVVTVIPGPDANFSINPNPVEALETAQFTDLSTGASSIVGWYWAFGDSTASNLQNPTHSYNGQGDFSVVLAVRDINGCIDTVRQDISVVLLPDVPTAFSPNGDGQNDLFLVRGGPFRSINVRIYNNWGQLIFETNDQLEGWNGTFNGTEQPIGVFIWVVEVEMLNEKKIKKTGDVTLLR